MMTIDIAHSSPVDPYLLWQAQNGAAFCNRMSATITAITCENNRKKTGIDCRCNGCAGLHDQEQPLPKQSAIGWYFDEKPETEPATPPGSASSATKKDALAALDEIIDDLYASPLPGDDFDDVELDLDDEQLLALFPELAQSEKEDSEINFPRFIEYQTAMPRYAVYKGRCKKCGGYVENVRERQDDNVYRCLSCGWRTGLEYENNREHYSKGGVIL
jgi:hypothetical protein